MHLDLKISVTELLIPQYFKIFPSRDNTQVQKAMLRHIQFIKYFLNKRIFLL